MSPDEFDEHYEDWREDAWGHHQVVSLLATLCAMFANAHRREGSREVTAADFLPQSRPVVEAEEVVEAKLADVMQFMKDAGCQL